MKRSKIFLAVLAATTLLVAGCDSIDANTLEGADRKAEAADEQASLAKGNGAATIVVGADVTDWTSSAPNPAQGLIPIGGSGQVNGEFTIATRDGIELALRAQERSQGPLDATGKKVGVYRAETGYEPGTNNTRAWWNYDWHVDLRGTGTTLSDYYLTLHFTNLANETYGEANPFDLTFGDPFFDNVVLYQQSWNPLFGHPDFDPTAEGTYNLRLRLAPKDGGPPLSVKIQVVVSDPS